MSNSNEDDGSQTQSFESTPFIIAGSVFAVIVILTVVGFVAAVIANNRRIALGLPPLRFIPRGVVNPRGVGMGRGIPGIRV
jgi:hypothetical protein